MELHHNIILIHITQNPFLFTSKSGYFCFYAQSRQMIIQTQSFG